MSTGEKRTPGQVVSPAEMNDLVRQLKDIYTHLGTNTRHLASIEAKAERLKARLEALLPEEVPETEEEEPHILGPNDLCPLGWAWLIGDCNYLPDSGSCDDCERDLAPIMEEDEG